jgi:hypothetical protein
MLLLLLPLMHGMELPDESMSSLHVFVDSFALVHSQPFSSSILHIGCGD